jgi:hypothetical protein
MDWKHLLAYITGTVNQELLLRNEYLVTENRILVWSKNSCGFARVVFQEPPEPFTTLHRALTL